MTVKTRKAADTKLAARRKLGKKFLAAFGSRLGAKWFAEGMTFAEAQAAFKPVQKRRAKLAAKLRATNPPRTLRNALGAGAAKFAQSLYLR